MAIIAIHGIATSGGGLFRLASELEVKGHDVEYYRYEKRHFWSYWFKDNMRHDGASLLHSAEYKSHDRPDVVCHSNGQLVVQSAIEQGAKFGRVIIISGAGTSDKFTWPKDSVEQVHWFVNVSDLAVWFGALLYNHPFGMAARIGYAGPEDHRHVNHKYNRDKWFSIDHSFWFNDEWRSKIAKKINGLLS